MEHEEHGTLFDWLADPDTDPMLLPDGYRRRDNSENRRIMKKAIKIAAAKALSPAQKRRLEKCYAMGMTTAQIAASERRERSVVTKSIQSAQNTIREYAEIYMAGYAQAKKDIQN